MEARQSKGLQDFQPKAAGAASTAKRLCNKAQGWDEGTTLGAGERGAANPNGVVAGGDHRRLVFWPPGHNPVGVGVFGHVPAHPEPDGQSACKAGELPKGIGAKTARKERRPKDKPRWRLGLGLRLGAAIRISEMHPRQDAARNRA